MAIDPKTGLPDDTKKISVPAYLKLGKIITWLLYAWIMFGIIMLALRTFLLATSANSTSFVDFVYRTSADFLQPFRGIFPPKNVGETGYLDVSAIFAIIIYLIIAWLISAGIKFIQAKIDDLREQEQERAERNRKRLEQQQRLATRGQVVKETTYVRQPANSQPKNKPPQKRV
jgi:uncharacterized protein YggT (Ycf19 family)